MPTNEHLGSFGSRYVRTTKKVKNPYVSGSLKRYCSALRSYAWSVLTVLWGERGGFEGPWLLLQQIHQALDLTHEKQDIGEFWIYFEEKLPVGDQQDPAHLCQPGLLLLPLGRLQRFLPLDLHHRTDIVRSQQ